MNEEPLVRVVHGAPTAEEVAALVGVLSRLATAADPIQPTVASTWVRRARPAAAPFAGPGGWRASGLPR